MDSDKDELASDSFESSASADATSRPSEFRYRFLDELGQATRGLNDANQIMAVSARLLGAFLGATRCAYADVEPDNDRFTIRNDWSAPGVPTSVGTYSLDLFGPKAAGNLRAGKHLVVNDVDGELGEEGGASMFNAIGIKAIICAGLVKNARLVAMMAVHQAEPRRWSEQEIALVEEVVDRCWAHVERVRDAAALLEQDRRKDEFLATLAHELRNPLAPVKYALAIMNRTQDAAAQAQARNVIDRQVSQMARLIDDLLDVSRISRGLIQLQMQDVLLRDVLEQAVEAAQPAISEGRHNFTFVPPTEELWIHADPARLVQVVSNLLTNAAKYTPDGGAIRLTAWDLDRDAIVEVVDNGIGIVAEDQGRLFELFTQLHRTAGRAKGGLGIGLSLVRKLVSMHGGSVSVASAGPDAGSTFTVRLPLASRMEAPLVPSDSLEMTGDERQLRVLVVEDNPDGRASLVTLLQLHGHLALGSRDGAQALEAADAFAPEVVLLDLGLPSIDGYEVCRRLRQSPRHSSATIVAMTGWGSESDRRQTLAAGFDAHLTKPVEPALLSQLMRQVINRERQKKDG